MDDRALYATIRGLDAPWDVERVELREAEQAVHVWVREAMGTSFGCPECAASSPIYDHVERVWRHLDTCQFQTLLHAAVPRVRCATHGVRTIRVPWAERHSHFTLLFEHLAIAWLTEATPTAVARRLGLTWEEANGIVERAVRRGLRRRASVAGRRLGIDEHSYLRRHQFVTMGVDLAAQTVLYVGDDRKAASLDRYFSGRTLADRSSRGSGGKGIAGSRGPSFLWLKSDIGRADFSLAPRRTFAVRKASTLKASTLKAARAWAMKEAIQWIKYSSRGFRDRERFKTAIYFHCGGLDLEPR